MNCVLKIIISVIFVIFGTLGVPASLNAQMTTDEFNDRLAAMEKENDALREQIDAQKTAQNSVPTDAQIPAQTSAPTDAQIPAQNYAQISESLSQEVSKQDLFSVPVSTGASDGLLRSSELAESVELEESERDAEKYNSVFLNMSQDDLEAELARYKSWKWDKNHLTLTPYVWFWLTATHETNQMFAGEYPLWVRNTDRSHTYFDMKATRLGFNLTAPEISSLPGVQVSSVFESDFENTYTSENKADMELRKAYIQFKSEDSMLLIGQTWELLSPYYPTVLNWGFGSAGGNFGFRRPQIRYDRYFKRENGRFAVQTCVLSSSTSNFTASDGSFYSGKMGRYPEFQLRLERSYDEFGLWDSATFAAGAKIGDKEYVMNSDEFHRTSWAFTAETKIRFTEKVFLLGEFYVGELLAVNCASIMQDLNPQTRENIGSTGGWFSIMWDFMPDWHTSVGYSIDDVWDSKVARGMRSQNYFTFINISHDITKAFNVGFEYEYYNTTYCEDRDAHSNLFMICAMYKI